ncbi:MAG: hypothetical protein RLO21_09985, partial [Nitratireductor sp.]
MRKCYVPGCAKPAASRWGNYCNSHKSRLRRHGHPLQRTITKTELEDLLSVVDEVIERNALSPLWEITRSRWDEMLDRCRATNQKWEEGRPVNNHHLTAARSLLALEENV